MLRARKGSPEKKSVSPRYGHQCVSQTDVFGASGSITNIFEVLEEVRNSLSFVVREDRLV